MYTNRRDQLKEAIRKKQAASLQKSSKAHWWAVVDVTALAPLGATTFIV